MTDAHFRYLPVMVSRLMLSLKKAAGSQVAWSLAEPSVNNPNLETISFFHSREDTSKRDDGILLNTYSES